MPSPDHATPFLQEFPALAEALRGQFLVERELGRGGMGVVYLARELQLDRLVALKVLPPLLATQPDTRERFLREARTAARLAHPNVVPVYRADEAGGTAFFAMAFVDGETLAERLRDRGPLPPAAAVPILRASAWALAYAHARGVVHRDVKPENILLERATGRTLVTDFGIAHHATLSGEAARLTQDGHVLGTLHYMSPEQVSGERLDGRSDLYALGVVAFQVLSGRLPFEGLPATAVLVAHASRPAPLLRDVAPEVPGSLAAVVDRCLAKRPDDRYHTGEALADALEQALAEAPEPVRSAGPALPPGLPERIDEAQAAAIWRRAAQLQADALHRMEARESLLRIARAEGADGQGTEPTGGGASSAPAAGASSFTPGSGYRVADVAGAAEEAGISRQYVAMALAELPRGGLPSTTVLGVGEREATTFLGTDVRSVSVAVEIPAAPARTLRVMGAILQQTPYELKLRATVGAHPLDGGVIVFDLPGDVMSMSGVTSGNLNRYWTATRQYLEASQLQVTMRPVAGGAPGARERTEVRMTADLRPGVRRNVRAAQWSGGVVGGSLGLAATVLGAKGAAVAASAAVLGPAIGIAAVSAGLIMYAYRRFYSGTLSRVQKEMREALEAIAAAIQAEEVFGTVPGSVRTLPARPPNHDDDGSAAVISLLS
jgi:predicted Ser/Thr protein kinase